jgi:hypothetical protein
LVVVGWEFTRMTARTTVSLVVLVLAGAPAQAQLIGPAGDAPPKAPTFTPRPVSVTAPSRPLPERRTLDGTFSAVRRDAAGKVLPITLPPDYEVFDAFARSLGDEEIEFRRRFQDTLDAREQGIEDLLINEITPALSLRQSQPELLTVTEVKRVQELATLTRKFMLSPPLITEITEGGRFNESLALGLRSAVSDLRTAITQSELEGVDRADRPRHAAMSSRIAVRLNGMEAMMILDRMLTRAGRRWSAIVPALGLSPEQQAKVDPIAAGLSSAASDADVANLAAKIAEHLSGQQKTLMFQAVRAATIAPAAAPAGDR